MKFLAFLALIPVALPALAVESPYPAAGHGHASYEVPVSDDLKPFSVYPIDDINSTEKNDVVTIKYTLPVMLTGAKNDIVLTSTKKATDGTFTHFEGPNGSANCDADSCNVHYHDLKLDAVAARQNLMDMGINGDALTKRLAVFDAFSGDPAGIIRFQQSSTRK